MIHAALIIIAVALIPSAIGVLLSILAMVMDASSGVWRAIFPHRAEHAAIAQPAKALPRTLFVAICIIALLPWLYCAVALALGSLVH